MFRTKSAAVITECQQVFGFQPILNQINSQKIKLLHGYITSPKFICAIASKQCAVNELQAFKYRV